MKSMVGMKVNPKIGMDVFKKTPPVKAQARLVLRQYFSTAGTQSITIPASAKYAIIRMIGSGGHPTVTNFSAGGAGYARSTFLVVGGESMMIKVAQYNGGSTEAGTSRVTYRDNLVEAYPGTSTGFEGTNYGSGGSGLGDIVRPGGEGYRWGFGNPLGNWPNGGDPGENILPYPNDNDTPMGAQCDDLDADSIGVTGYGANWGGWTGSEPSPNLLNMPSSYGGGGSISPNGTIALGSGGYVAVEFWDNDPR